jgi:amidase
MKRAIGLVCLIALAVAAAPALSAPLTPAPDRASIGELQAAMSDGRLTSEALVRFYLRRIARLDRGRRSLRAIIALNSDVLAEARALDAERRAKGPLRAVRCAGRIWWAVRLQASTIRARCATDIE